MDTEYYEYESDHADRFHDYEEDAMQEEQVDEGDDYPEEGDDEYFDEFSNDDNPYNEDLGWDGGYKLVSSILRENKAPIDLLIWASKNSKKTNG